MRFDYFEIRACVQVEDEVVSFLGDPQWCQMRGGPIFTPTGAHEQAKRFCLENSAGPIFWTLYGCGPGEATAIGDFKDFDTTFEVMNAILAPMAAARDALDHNLGEDSEALRSKMRAASSTLEDFINQSSTDEKADVLLDKASTPEVLAAHFRKAAQQYLEDASELRAMWQDATAGLIWETIGRDLDKLADKIDRAWSRT